MAYIVWERSLELIQIHLGITAFPCGEGLQVRPVVAWKRRIVLLLQATQLGCTFRIGFEICFQLLADIVRDIQIAVDSTILDIFHIFVVVFDGIVLHFYDGRRIGRYQHGNILLDAESHDSIVACVVVRDIIYHG